MTNIEQMMIQLIAEGYEITFSPGDDWHFEIAVNQVGDSDTYHGQGDTLAAALNDAWMGVPERETVTVRFSCGHVAEMPASLWKSKQKNVAGEHETILICEDCEIEEIALETTASEGE